jgi:putative FmdB family regulatory protein
MPTYVYECENCKHTFDEFAKITSESRKTCPKCGGKVKRLIQGGSGLIFKGKGFYATDYGRGR